MDQLTSGVYSFLPLGFRVLKNIEKIIRREMESIGGQELLMPVLQPKENWVKTGRWESLDILFKVEGSGDKEYALGPTHEEVVAPLAKRVIFSYKDLPLSVFQIQTKFRDELRAKSGILRTREFLMKDLYSFHSSDKDLEDYYEKVAKSYEKIFKECGVGKITHRTFASGGTFSKYSEEFQTITDAGEDIIYVCQKCNMAVNKEIKNENPTCPSCKNEEFKEKKSVEVGNIFKMGAKYSIPFDLKFTDRNGEDKSVLMGCYGIGVSRLMGAVSEANHDGKGIIWPKSVAPFTVHLIGIEKNGKTLKVALKLYADLSSFVKTSDGQAKQIEVLWDERQDKSPGEKFAEADLIGIPYRVVVSEKTIAKNCVELKERGKDSVRFVKIKELAKIFK